MMRIWCWWHCCLRCMACKFGYVSICIHCDRVGVLIHPFKGIHTYISIKCLSACPDSVIIIMMNSVVEYRKSVPKKWRSLQKSYRLLLYIDLQWMITSSLYLSVSTTNIIMRLYTKVCNWLRNCNLESHSLNNYYNSTKMHSPSHVTLSSSLHGPCCPVLSVTATANE